VLEADPRRVKKLKISLNSERLNGQSREQPRLAGSSPAGAAATPPPASDLPVAPDPSVKLAPDASPKAARRP
jgi:hypothetical protein